MASPHGLPGSADGTSSSVLASEPASRPQVVAVSDPPLHEAREPTGAEHMKPSGVAEIDSLEPGGKPDQILGVPRRRSVIRPGRKPA